MTNAFILVLTLIGLDVSVSLLTLRSRLVDRLINDVPLVLLENGRLFKDRMRKARVRRTTSWRWRASCRGSSGWTRSNSRSSSAAVGSPSCPTRQAGSANPLNPLRQFAPRGDVPWMDFFWAVHQARGIPHAEMVGFVAHAAVREVTVLEDVTKL